MADGRRFDVDRRKIIWIEGWGTEGRDNLVTP